MVQSLAVPSNTGTPCEDAAWCRVAKWIAASFGGEEGVQQGPQGVYAHFVSLRDGCPLTITMQGTQVRSCF